MEKRKADQEEQLAIAKAGIYGGIDPVDLKRCQADRRVGDVWRIGDPIRWIRCDRTPVFVAIEPQKDENGLRGAMSLCRTCHKEFVHQRPDCIVLPSAPFKAAFLLGGHKAVRDMVYDAKRPV